MVKFWNKTSYFVKTTQHTTDISLLKHYGKTFLNF
jgi:hypothetical protein